jgi:protein gp37
MFRADHLRSVSPAVRFLSLEPLLGPLYSLDLLGIHWVIVGGESGRGARAINPDLGCQPPRPVRGSGRSIFLQAMGGRTPKAGGRELQGRTWSEMPRLLATTP